MTNQQRTYIIALRLYELAKGKGGIRKSVTKRFFANLLEKNWQTANTKQLKSLVDLGYLQAIIGGNNTVFYSLTKKAIKAADKAVNAAHEFEWDVEQPALMEINTLGFDENGGISWRR